MVSGVLLFPSHWTSSRLGAHSVLRILGFQLTGLALSDEVFIGQSRDTEGLFTLLVFGKMLTAARSEHTLTLLSKLRGLDHLGCVMVLSS